MIWALDHSKSIHRLFLGDCGLALWIYHRGADPVGKSTALTESIKPPIENPSEKEYTTDSPLAGYRFFDSGGVLVSTEVTDTMKRGSRRCQAS
jgi:hypothetical protein